MKDIEYEYNENLKNEEIAIGNLFTTNVNK